MVRNDPTIPPAFVAGQGDSHRDPGAGRKRRGAGAVRLGKRTHGSDYEVKRGEFLDSLQFRGEVKALKSVTISAPAEAGDLQIIKVSPEGTAVKSGDVVVEFDKTKTEQDLAQVPV